MPAGKAAQEEMWWFLLLVVQHCSASELRVLYILMIMQCNILKSLWDERISVSWVYLVNKLTDNLSTRTVPNKKIISSYTGFILNESCGNGYATQKKCAKRGKINTMLSLIIGGSSITVCNTITTILKESCSVVLKQSPCLFSRWWVWPIDISCCGIDTDSYAYTWDECQSWESEDFFKRFHILLLKSFTIETTGAIKSCKKSPCSSTNVSYSSASINELFSKIIIANTEHCMSSCIVSEEQFVISTTPKEISEVFLCYSTLYFSSWLCIRKILIVRHYSYLTRKQYNSKYACEDQAEHEWNTQGLKILLHRER